MGQSEENQVELRVAARALGEMQAAKRRWLENRDKNPELLEYELAQAFEQIKTTPRLGIHFQVHRGKGRCAVQKPDALRDA